jgi:hypothetical protein
MLQYYISSVSYVSDVYFICVFSNTCCNCVYLDVAYVYTYVACVFIRMLSIIAMIFKCVSGVYSSVSETCFKCFIFLQTYVAIVASRCFKSRYEVFAHVAMVPVTDGQRLVAGLRLLPRAEHLSLSSPFPSLHLAATVRARPRRGVQWRYNEMGHRAGALYDVGRRCCVRTRGRWRGMDAGGARRCGMDAGRSSSPFLRAGRSNLPGRPDPRCPPDVRTLA